jgi:hypothetical protein
MKVRGDANGWCGHARRHEQAVNRFIQMRRKSSAYCPRSMHERDRQAAPDSDRHVAMRKARYFAMRRFASF